MPKSRYDLKHKKIKLSYFLKRLIFDVLIWNRFVESPSVLLTSDIEKVNKNKP